MDARASSPRSARLIAFLLTLVIVSCAAEEDPHLGTVRVVFQTKYGDIEFGFYPKVAPRTVAHILKLVKLGAYNTNHFFRAGRKGTQAITIYDDLVLVAKLSGKVDKGFVAQVADVVGGREAPLNEEQREEGEKTVPGEFSKVQHVRGILSMGRYSDPDSGASSFSMLLGDAPHLDEQYAIFGKVTKGDAVLSRLEQLPTRTEGMFVMPLERITILSTYYYDLEEKVASCEKELDILKRRLVKANSVLQIQRTKCLP